MKNQIISNLLNMKNLWMIDHDHSELRFEIDYLMISKVSGSIANFDGSFETDESGFKNITQVRLSAEVDSLNTNSLLRDEHLKSDQYFDIANYSQILFEGVKFEQGAAEPPVTFLSAVRKDFKITGVLTMKGVSKTIVVEGLYGGSAVDSKGRKKAGFAIKTKIKRSDFKVGSNSPTSAEKLLLGDEVIITANCQFIKV
jgi:polyisoprenoid-binding protein YceI